MNTPMDTFQKEIVKTIEEHLEKNDTSVISIHLICIILNIKSFDVNKFLDYLTFLLKIPKFKLFIPDFTSIILKYLQEKIENSQKKIFLCLLQKIFSFFNSDESAIFHAISAIFEGFLDLNDEFYDKFLLDILTDYSQLSLTNKGFLRFFKVCILRRKDIVGCFFEYSYKIYKNEILYTLCSSASWNQTSNIASDCIKLLLENKFIDFDDLFHEFIANKDLKFSNLEIFNNEQIIDPKSILDGCFRIENFIELDSEDLDRLSSSHNQEVLKRWLYILCYYIDLDKIQIAKRIVDLDPKILIPLKMASKHFDDQLRFLAFKSLGSILAQFLLRSSSTTLSREKSLALFKLWLEMFNSSIKTQIPKQRAQTMKALSDFVIVIRDAASTTSLEEEISSLSLENNPELGRSQIGCLYLNEIIQMFLKNFTAKDGLLFPIGLPYSEQSFIVAALKIFYEQLDFNSKSTERISNSRLSYTKGTLTLIQDRISRLTSTFDWQFRDFSKTLDFLVDNLKNITIDLQEVLMKLISQHCHVQGDTSIPDYRFEEILKLSNAYELTHYTASANILSWLVSSTKALNLKTIMDIIHSSVDMSILHRPRDLLVQEISNKSHLGLLTFLEKLYQHSPIDDDAFNLDNGSILKIMSLSLFAFELMGGKRHQVDESGKYSIEYEGSTSFEGIAVSISESCQDELETAFLTPQYQRLMSWTWHVVMIASSVCAKWASLKLKLPTINDKDKEIIRNIGLSLMHILLTCRHRGTIETVGVPLAEYLNATNSFEGENTLLNSSEVLSYCYQTLTQCKYSVARRAAGLWHLVKSAFYAMISSNSRKTHYLYSNQKLMDQLDRWIKMLYRISLEDSKSSEFDFQTDDDPRALAMHIMRGLFADSKISPYLLALEPETGEGDWLSKVMINVVSVHFCDEKFRNSNAALQLFTSFLQKLVGVVRSGSGPFFHEIFASYPALLVELKRILSTTCHDESQTKIFILWLSLLSSVHYSPKALKFEEEIRQVLTMLSRHLYEQKNLHLKKMSAMAIVNLNGKNEIPRFIRQKYLIQPIFTNLQTWHKPDSFDLNENEFLDELLILDAYFSRKFHTFSELSQQLQLFSLDNYLMILAVLIRRENWYLADMLCKIGNNMIILINKLQLRYILPKSSIGKLQSRFHTLLSSSVSIAQEAHFNYFWTSLVTMKANISLRPIQIHGAEEENLSSEEKIFFMRCLMVDETLISKVILSKNFFQTKHKDFYLLLAKSLAQTTEAIHINVNDLSAILESLSKRIKDGCYEPEIESLLIQCYVKIYACQNFDNRFDNTFILDRLVKLSEWTSEESCRYQCAKTILLLTKHSMLLRFSPSDKLKVKLLSMLYFNCYDECENIRACYAQAIACLLKQASYPKQIYVSTRESIPRLAEIIFKDDRSAKTNLAIVGTNIWNYIITLMEENFVNFIKARERKVLYDFDLANLYPNYQEFLLSAYSLIKEKPAGEILPIKLKTFNPKKYSIDSYADSISLAILRFSCEILVD